jgi:hypothetical protein
MPGTPAEAPRRSPTTPAPQRPPAITRHGFSLIRFRSPLLTESQLFSLPAGTEMFHFPAFPPHTLYIQVRVTPLIIRVPGFPIRTSSDHSSVDNSPRPIAVSHVLHRLLVPRHPPCALTHFTTTRCSHPLCNTQQTTTPPPTTNTTTHTNTTRG